MAFSAGAASLEHIAQEAGDISGVAHADAEALLGSVHGLEDGGSLAVLLEVAGGAIVQMQDYLNLGGEARMNFPGKPSGNWTWRAKKGFASNGLAAKILELTNRYDRGPADEKV